MQVMMVSSGTFLLYKLRQMSRVELLGPRPEDDDDDEDDEVGEPEKNEKDEPPPEYQPYDK